MAEKDCASCGAKLAEGAAWCSLCYAPVDSPALVTDVLTDEQEDELEAASLNAASLNAAAVDSAMPVAQPFGQQQAPGGLLVADVAVQMAATEAADEAATTTAAKSWPCLGCGAPNSMDVSVCEACGLPFLAHAKTPPSLHVPGIGDIFQRSRPQQIAFIAGAGLVMLVVVLGLMGIVGLIF